MSPMQRSLMTLACMMAVTPALADQVATSSAGQSLPVTTAQPSLVLTQVLVTQGAFPSRGGSGANETMGMVRQFGGNFGPFGTPQLQGQLMPIASNTALYSVFFNLYGGDGTTTFALPDLSGRFTLSSGQAPGQPAYQQGAVVGAPQVTLTTSNLAAHTHAVVTPAGLTMTTVTGNSVPFSNLKPTVTMKYIIAADGFFPSRSGGSVGLPFLGQVRLFAGNFAPSGWAAAEGQLLPISQYAALFAVLGTTFGGDGVTTFALPDLRGHIPVGTGARSGGFPVVAGQTYGSASNAMTVASLPSHAHAVAVGDTMLSGNSQSLQNAQPSVGLAYAVALVGVYPSRDSGSWPTDTPVIGEVFMFAGDYAPGGMALAQGQLLPINSNQALFSLLGTTYGGDGVTTFALPDLRGRGILGTGTGNPLGRRQGSDTTALTVAQMPAHDHLYEDGQGSSSSGGSSSGIASSSAAASSSSSGGSSSAAASSSGAASSSAAASSSNGGSSSAAASSSAGASSSAAASSSNGGNSSAAASSNGGSSGAAASSSSNAGGSSGSSMMASSQAGSSGGASSSGAAGSSSGGASGGQSSSTTASSGNDGGDNGDGNTTCTCAVVADRSMAEPALLVGALVLVSRFRRRQRRQA